MTIQVLKCDECERLAHNLSMEGKICNWRFFDGRHCQGTLSPSELERVLDPHLECDTCERRADNMDMEGKVCQWRLPNGGHCDGILETVDA